MFGSLFGEGFGGPKNVKKCSHHYVQGNLDWHVNGKRLHGAGRFLRGAEMRLKNVIGEGSGERNGFGIALGPRAEGFPFPLYIVM